MLNGAVRSAPGKGYTTKPRQQSDYSRGALIPLDAQSLWLVEQGEVKLTYLEIQGTETIVGIAAPGMVFGRGLSSLDVYQATALGEVRLNQFLLADLEASAEVAQTLLPPLMQRLQQTEALLAVAGQRTLEMRLQQLLLWLAQVVGQPVAGGIRLSIRLTHEELASMIRSSRVSVTRLLGQFKHQGWLKVDGKRHLVLQHSGEKAHFIELQ